MKRDTIKTVVIFRKYKEGDILALFPEIDEGNYKCSCYQRIGQHGLADYDHCIRMTQPARPEEYERSCA
jgi:hypothetical protein